MLKMAWGAALLSTGLALAGCSSGGLAGRDRPDEFAVARQAPLVVPPDFALVPPRPGEPRPTGTDSSKEALQAMFGGSVQRSAGEAATLNAATSRTDNALDPAIRSEVGDPQTNTVDKGTATRDIVNAQPTQGQNARVETPQ